MSQQIYMGAKYLILQELWRKKACFCGILIEVILPSFSGDAGCRKITLHDWRKLVEGNSFRVQILSRIPLISSSISAPE